MHPISRSVVGFTVATLSLTARGAWAQDSAPATAPPAPATPAPPAPVAPSPSVAPPGPAAEEEVTDHDRFVGHLGVTYFDVTDLPIANPLADPGNGQAAIPTGITGSTVSAPVIGVRYWLRRNLGIDVGLGLGFAGGSQELVVSNTDTTVDKVSSTGFAIHGGVPIALFYGKHYTFLAIPEVTLGFTSATFKPTAGAGGTAGPNQDLSGFLFDGGARVGAEIHFGFIGIPQLALQATVGLSYRRSVYKWKSDANSASDGTNSFGTHVQADPWALFKDAISATYYF